MIKGSDIIRKNNSKVFTNPFIKSGYNQSRNALKRPKSERSVDLDIVLSDTTLYMNGRDIKVINNRDITITKVNVTFDNKTITINYGKS